MQELLESLALGRLDGNYRKVVNAYKKLDLLILDEFLIRKLTEEQASDLLEIVEIRSHGNEELGTAGLSTIAENLQTAMTLQRNRFPAMVLLSDLTSELRWALPRPGV